MQNQPLSSFFPTVELFAGTIAILIALVVVLFSLVFIYLVIRQRNDRAEVRDPQAGIKAVLHYFLSIGLILMMIGLSVLAVDVLKDEGVNIGGKKADSWLNSTRRSGLALAVSGLLFTLIYWLILKLGTNDRKWPVPRRLFAGWRFVIHAFVVLYVVTNMVLILFEEDYGASHWDQFRNLFALLLVWAPFWVGHLILLSVYSKEPDVPKSVGPPREGAR